LAARAPFGSIAQDPNPMNYFGARDVGPPVQDREAVTLAAWQGIVAVVLTGLRTGLFIEDFPDRSCVDHGFEEAITGCNEHQFFLRLRGDHPDIPVPFNPDVLPETVAALELVEFCHRHASQPFAPAAHDHFAHRHYLNFRRAEGQAQLAEQINSIFERNHLAYELQVNGEVRRLMPAVLREALASAEFRTEDHELNRLLESARLGIGSPDFHQRYNSLRDLWDAFERPKTLEPPRDDVRRSAEALLARATQEPRFREMLSTEMRVVLPDFGNGFFIRHANAEQVVLQTGEEIDYLFHRLFALIRFLIRSTGRGQ
jgi:hypothetical protein